MPSAMPAWVIDPVSRLPVVSLGDHHVRGFDYRERVIADLESKIVDRFIGDRGGDDGSTADVDTDMRCRLTLGYGDNLALELVAGAELHPTLLGDEQARLARPTLNRHSPPTIHSILPDIAFQQLSTARADRRAADRGQRRQADLRSPRARSPTPARPRPAGRGRPGSGPSGGCACRRRR